MNSSASDEVFSSLPKSTQRRIDDAFYLTIARLRSGTPSIGHTAGEGSGGGFIPDEDDNGRNEADQIPLDLVPETLKHLNLPEDDEVLAVFQNAATGWASSSLSPQAGPSQSALPYQLAVSLEDWRAVCSVLLEAEAEADDGQEGRGRNRDIRQFGEDSSGDESVGYNEEEQERDSSDSAVGDSGDDDDSDEFIPGQRQVKGRRPLPRNVMSEAAQSSSTGATKLSARQEQAALDTFALFFPYTPPTEVPKQKIMIKDIQRIAALLKEKFKSEEIIDMLEMFSSSPDKSMSFADFVKMLGVVQMI